LKPQRSSLERALEEAVSRALRDNLAPLQRTADELHQAYADLVASCASTRPSNALPAMLRAQTAAAALAAGLSVLSNFVAVALNPREGDAGAGAPVAEPGPEAAEAVGEPTSHAELEVSRPAAHEIAAENARLTGTQEPETASLTGLKEPKVAQSAPLNEPEIELEFESQVAAGNGAAHAQPAHTEPIPLVTEPVPQPEEHIVDGFIDPPAKELPVFDIAALPPELQDLHRRANRVAKVAMQDIKLLRPKDVESGRQHKDICERLRVDLDKARKEYDRRFRAISDHPVDYFHHWMLEILAGGDRAALGQYPYPSAVLRH
jgi:hypothetical protein